MTNKARLNDRQIALRLTDVERAQAFTLAESEGRTTGNFVRQMYRMGLAQFLKQQPAARPAHRA